MTNPAPVQSGQPIASVWGNATRSTVVLAYPSKGAYLAEWPAPQEGQTVAIGGQLYTWRAGALHAHATITMAPFGVAYGNLIGHQVVGSITLPQDIVARTWRFTWSWHLSNHTAQGSFRTMLYAGENLVAVDSTITTLANVWMSGMTQFQLGHPADVGASIYNLVCEVGGGGANTNLQGGVQAEGYPA